MGMRYKPCQFFTPLCLLVIAVGGGCRYAVFQLGQPRDNIPELVLDIFAFLGSMHQRDHGMIQRNRTS